MGAEDMALEALGSADEIENISDNPNKLVEILLFVRHGRHGAPIQRLIAFQAIKKRLSWER